MTIKDKLTEIEECYPNDFEKFDKVFLKSVFTNEKKISEKFKKVFKKSPFSYVVRVPFAKKKGSKLLTKIREGEYDVRQTQSVSFLESSTIKRMLK
ncbi:MAG: hypothetical protein WC346_07880 [Methanogenium sp.]|jgi:hypothetical protein